MKSHDVHLLLVITNPKRHESYRLHHIRVWGMMMMVLLVVGDFVRFDMVVVAVAVVVEVVRLN
jgi:hypothetical protein